MAVGSRDMPFAALASQDRAVLLGTSYLLLGDAARARAVVDAVLAGVYRRWPSLANPRRTALQEVVAADPQSVRLPWTAPDRFELVDGGLVARHAPPIVGDLGRLSPVQRNVLVLTAYAGLGPADVAALLDLSGPEVAHQARLARFALGSREPARLSDTALASELSEAVPLDLRDPTDGRSDLANGRRLRRRRWGRAGLVAAAAAVVVAVVASQVVARPVAEESVFPDPVPTVTATPAPPRIACDPGAAACRESVLRDWRTEIANVTSAYLDPTQAYFRGYRVKSGDRFETPGFWAGRGGVLGFEMAPVGVGTTEVYVQVATSRGFAARCGSTTGTSCVTTRFMSGNRFTLSNTTSVSEGLEVQYAPDGDQVITVTARNLGPGPELAIGRGDLVNLAQDPRLRLPNL